jgi:endonuclease-3
MTRAPRRTTPGRERPRSAGDRLPALLAGLDRAYPDATCALAHGNAFELLIATILSAQCTDERVNLVTPGLFARFPTAAAMARTDQETLEGIIRSTGFFRNKARSLLGASRRLVLSYGGEVPRTMDALLTLPGVARKTANVVLGTAYGLTTGVVVDTHVTRLAGRLGLTTETDPPRIEQDLMSLLPEARWISFSHQLILHGRQVCQARTPHCEACPLAPHCPSSTAG